MIRRVNPYARRARVFALIALLLSIIAITLALCSLAGKARADLGNAGPGPAPGLCFYPAVCDSGMVGAGAGAAYWYWEDFPVELNGSHRHCEWGAAATDANIGFSMLVQVGVTAPLGAAHGGCFYVCPSMARADMPNPVGGWKDAIRPTTCQPTGPNPFTPPPEDVPIAPPIAEQGAVSAVPFGQLPSVTNPACPNPVATNNDQCGGG